MNKLQLKGLKIASTIKKHIAPLKSNGFEAEDGDLYPGLPTILPDCC